MLVTLQTATLLRMNHQACLSSGTGTASRLQHPSPMLGGRIAQTGVHGRCSCLDPPRLRSWQVAGACREHETSQLSEASQAEEGERKQDLGPHGVSNSRRSVLVGAVAAAASAAAAAGWEGQAQAAPGGRDAAAARCWSSLEPLSSSSYGGPGPLHPVDLPRLEHTCVTCFPACVGDGCLLGIDVTYPKGGPPLGLHPPYPLLVFTGGFTLPSSSYRDTARHMASWGYTVVRYDTRDHLPSPLDDVTHVALLRELLDWAATHPLLRQLADTSNVYLAGHSRGGKLSTLAATQDPRVKALTLIDPVDVTVYAPLSERFPSAVAALQQSAESGRFLPVAIVGSGRSGDCAPTTSNYSHFYSACPSACWQVVLSDAGHFSYMDSSSPLLQAVCGAGGGVSLGAVRQVSRAVMVAWGEAMVRGRGQDVVSTLRRHCWALGTPSPRPTPWYAAEVPAALAGTLPPELSQQQQQQQGQQPGWPNWSGRASSSSSISSGSESWRGGLGDQMALAESSISSSSGADPGAPSSTTSSSSSSSEVGSSMGSTGSSSRALQVVQSPLSSWAAPPPAELLVVRQQLQRLLTSLNYSNSTRLELRTSFRNFGAPESEI